MLTIGWEEIVIESLSSHIISASENVEVGQDLSIVQEFFIPGVFGDILNATI